MAETTGTVYIVPGRDVQFVPATGSLHFPNRTWMVALLGSTWTPDPGLQADWSQLEPFEFSGSGYTAGGQALTGTGINIKATVPDISYDLLANDPVWTPTGTWATAPYGWAVYDLETGKVALLGESRTEDRHSISSGAPYTIDFQAATAVPTIITADQQATPAAQLVLQKFIDMKTRTTKRCASGIHYASSSESTPGSAGASSLSYIAGQSGGKKPLILGAEYAIGGAGSRTGPTLTKLKSLNAVMRPLIDAGHVLKVWWHMPNFDPAGNGGYDWDGTANPANVVSMVTPGTGANANLEAFLDIQAAAFLDLDRPFLLGIGIEVTAADRWWTVQNIQIGPKNGGDPQRFIDLYRYIVAGLQSRGVHNALYVFHAHEYDPQGYDINYASGGALSYPAGSYFGSGVTGWEALYPGDDVVDMNSISVYTKTWSGKRDNAVMAYERTSPGKPFIFGEVGPGNSTPLPGWNVGSVLLPELQAAYVPGNTSSGESFVVGWMHWRDSNNDPSKQAGWSTIMNDSITCNLGDF